jgi:hypothetical protein
MTSNHRSTSPRHSDATLESMRLAAEAATLATCDLPVDTDLDDALTALTEVLATAATSKLLLEAVEQAAGRSSVSMESLRVAIFEFTRAHKSNGATPEAVLISLKGVVNQHRLPLLPRYMSDWSGDRLHATISSWCIEAYFKS